MPDTPCRRSMISRREALAGLAGLTVVACSRKPPVFNAKAPTSTVSIAKCATYGSELAPTLGRMFDQLGGLGKLVAGKTVALKVNLTGDARTRLGTIPAELTHFTHPAVVGATIRHLVSAGAARIRVVEGCMGLSDPLEEFMIDTGWDPSDMMNAGPNVELENTNWLGKGKRYHRLMGTPGAYILPGFDFNHSYAESDVVISIAKLKEHGTCGITLGMKNMFGATPTTIYGDGAGKDEPSVEPRGGRGSIMHAGTRAPSKSAPQEVGHNTSHEDTYRMPRIVVDVNAALPVHLTIIDGIYSMLGGEGPWMGRTMRPGAPGVLIAGLNPVCTDAVGTAVMGFDPAATRGQRPFERCDSFLELAEARGLGTRDLRRIEVVGTPIQDAVFDYRQHRPSGFPGSDWI